MLAACSTPPDAFEDGVPFYTAAYGVRDAHLQRVEEMACLRFDDALADRLDAALDADDLPRARCIAKAVIERGHRLAVEAGVHELERLEDDAIEALATRYFPDEAVTRTELPGRFLEVIDEQAEELLARIHEVDDVPSLRAVLRPIRDHLEKPVRDQGRAGRIAAWALLWLPSRIAMDQIYANEFRGNANVPFAQADVYAPAEAGTIDAEHGCLLAQFAPIVVQERDASAPYAPETDLIGAVTALDRDTILVDTQVGARVYAYAREIWIRDEPHLQLTYTHWYPEHPELKPNDPEAGHIEGVTLRVTLDRNALPIFLETVYNCGCYHRLYPAESLEARARTEFGAPLPGKSLALERAVRGRKDLIVPNTVCVPAVARRPVIRVRAGWHGIVDVHFEVDRFPQEHHTSALYELRPYEELEHLPLDDGLATSMFRDDGLVKGAERPERIFFTPAGLLSAGQPRQRGTQLIHFDDWSLDDPHLLDAALRLPASFH